MLTQAAILPAAAPTKRGWLLNCRILKGSATRLPYPVARQVMTLKPVALIYIILRALVESDGADDVRPSGSISIAIRMVQWKAIEINFISQAVDSFGEVREK